MVVLAALLLNMALVTLLVVVLASHSDTCNGDHDVLKSGEVVRPRQGGSVHVGQELAEGGQGILFTGQTESGQPVVIKCLKDRHRRKDDRIRTRALVDMALPSKCRALYGPVDSIDRADLVAHVAPFFEGTSLSEHVYPSNGSVTDNLEADLFLAAAVAHCLSVQHDQCDAANGDIHLDQFKVQHVGQHLELAQFDFDNQYRADLPLPNMVGKPDYIGPKTRKQWLAGQRPIPSIRDDLFSLGVVLHEILLRRHPGADAPTDSAEFHKSMSGPWLDDPCRPDRSSSLGGRPTACLNQELIERFRRTINPAASHRPNAARWRRSLIRAACTVGSCPSCAGQSVADKLRSHCPRCRKPFPFLKLVTMSSARIVLDQLEQMLGRQQLSGALTVSEQHCICRREPPLTTLESIGKNGTFVFSGSTWHRMPQRWPFAIEAGDRIRLADVELRVTDQGV